MRTRSTLKYRNCGLGGDFQLIAKAIEEKAGQLLGCKADLSRLPRSLEDKKEGSGIEVYGSFGPLT